MNFMVDVAETNDIENKEFLFRQLNIYACSSESGLPDDL